MFESILILLLFLLTTCQPVPTPTVTYGVPEEQFGYSIGDIPVDANLNIPDEALPVTYSLQGDPEIIDFFYIERFSGLLKTSSTDRIDCEDICIHTLTCTLRFSVFVSSKSLPRYFQVVTVDANILDINDNEPEFPIQTLNLTIPENEAPRWWMLPEASDLDTSAVMYYALSLSKEYADIFRLEVTNTGQKMIYPKIAVYTPLDREHTSMYRMKFFAMDGYNDPHTATVDIEIIVSDTNDNAPVFSQDAYAATIDMHEEVGQNVLTVEATDKDEGDNAKINYGIVPQDNDYPFKIAINTGNILVAKDLLVYSANNPNVVEFTVEARDLGTPAQYSTTSVFVTIVNGSVQSPTKPPDPAAVYSSSSQLCPLKVIMIIVGLLFQM